MNSNPQISRKTSVLPLAVIQILASVVVALSARNGLLQIGVFFVGAVCAMFALQMIVSKSYWYFLSAAISVCAAFLIGGIFPGAMCAFALPIGIMISSMIKKKSTKMSLVVSLDVLYLLLFAALFLIVYLLAGYEFSANAIIEYFSDIVEYLKDAVIAEIEADPELKAQLIQGLLINEEDFYMTIDASFETLKLLLPAIIISSIGVIAYITASLFKFGTVIANCELVLPDPKWEILPSKASATIYSLAYVIYSFLSMFSSSVGVVFVVCISIVIILSPLMMLMGVKWIMSSRNKVLIIILFVAGAIMMFPLAVIILAFFGVREIFMRHRKIAKQAEQDKKDQ